MQPLKPSRPSDPGPATSECGIRHGQDAKEAERLAKPAKVNNVQDKVGLISLKESGIALRLGPP